MRSSRKNPTGISFVVGEDKRTSVGALPGNVPVM